MIKDGREDLEKPVEQGLQRRQANGHHLSHIACLSETFGEKGDLLI